MSKIIKIGKRTGCNYCLIMDARLAEVSELAAEQGVAIEHKYIEDEPELVDVHGISGVPVTILEKDGIILDKRVGLIADDELQTIIRVLGS